MVQYYDTIDDNIREWAMAQAVFFIASAPTYGKHVNLSPKGLPSTSFSIVGPNLCAYIDATGSGNETISHLNENSRATIMFCSFATSPRILRFFCRGRVVEWDQETERKQWIKRMGVKSLAGARAIIVLDVFKVQTSCGFGVPMLALDKDPQDSSKQVPVFRDRETLGHWAGKRVARGEMAQYQAQNNIESLDGMPGLKLARRQNGERLLFIRDFKAGAKNNARGLWHLAGATILIVVLTVFSTVLALLYMDLLRIETGRRAWQEKLW